MPLSGSSLRSADKLNFRLEELRALGANGAKNSNSIHLESFNNLCNKNNMDIESGSPLSDEAPSGSLSRRPLLPFHSLRVSIEEETEEPEGEENEVFISEKQAALISSSALSSAVISPMESGDDSDKQTGIGGGGALCSQPPMYNELGRSCMMGNLSAPASPIISGQSPNANSFHYLHHHFHHHSGRVGGGSLRAAATSSVAVARGSSPGSNVALSGSVISMQPHRKCADASTSGPSQAAIRKLTRTRSNLDALNGLVFVLSAIYAKFIVILGLCFPMAEVMSHRIPIEWYEGFYLYLYLGSIFFLLIIYLSRESSKHQFNSFGKFRAALFWSNVNHGRMNSNRTTTTTTSAAHANRMMNCSFGSEMGNRSRGSLPGSSSCSDSSDSTEQQGRLHFGSFYLRLGAVAFGLGSMVYSGLEFGQFFELDEKEQCYSFLYGFTPTSHMVFTFFQLYFIFMNSKSLISKHRYLARFGLMHMIATNLCVWLHVLIQETKHQIMIIVYPNKTQDISLLDLSSHGFNFTTPYISHLTSISPLSSSLLGLNSTQVQLLMNPVHSVGINLNSTMNRHRRSIEDHEIFTTHGVCRRSNVIGQLVQDASQFLFPCTIEYSLISAAILYIMWKHTDTIIQRNSSSSDARFRHRSATSTSTVNHQYITKHQYQVDCAKAHKGLFCGIFLLVVCIISLILFFVLIKKPNYKQLGMLQAHLVEIVLYSINAIACAIAIMQIRELPYNRHRNVELDNILLIVAQSGLYIFNMFSLIGAHFFQDNSRNTQLVSISAIACLVQATLQTVFILDASRRSAHNNDQVRRKPGREMITFLLVCNFAMWAINTLETRRADSNPVQMQFYGFWAWTIITHITTPLTIFFRFHSTVCLCEIWKKSYKIV